MMPLMLDSLKHGCNYNTRTQIFDWNVWTVVVIQLVIHIHDRKTVYCLPMAFSCQKPLNRNICQVELSENQQILHWFLYVHEIWQKLSHHFIISQLELLPPERLMARSAWNGSFFLPKVKGTHFKFVYIIYFI